MPSAGLSVNGISNLERQIRTRPHVYTVHQLADALGLDDEERRALLGSLPTVEKAPSSTAAAEWPTFPTEPSPLIGRESELAIGMQLLQARGMRLVTLVGSGGVGRTRLAQRLVKSIAGQ